MAGSNGLTIKAGKRAKAKQQKQWLVETPSEDTEFTIRGTATLDYIKKGQIVEFTGRILEKDKIDEKGKEDRLADKVNEVTIVSARHIRLTRQTAPAALGATRASASGSRLPSRTSMRTRP